MDSVEIRVSNEKKGKGLFATKKFDQGDLIFEEEPLVSCQFAWNAEYKYLACEYCLRPLESPDDNVRRLSAKPDIMLPYPEIGHTFQDTIVTCESCFEMYCSEECRNKALASYHQRLCRHPNDQSHPIVMLLETWKKMHYPPETTNILLLMKILAMITQSPDPSISAAIVKQFCHRTVNEDAELVHKLLGNKFSNQLSVLRELTINVINDESIQEFLTPEGFCSLMALIGTNGQGIGTSPLSSWVAAVTEISMSDDEKEQLNLFIDKLYEQVEAESGHFLNTEGSGLYKVQSACNHSCVPNAEGSFPFNNHKIQLRALKTIMPGEEIFISYLDECALLRSRHSRQKELSQNYLFVCGCERCMLESSQPDITSDEDSMSEDHDD